MHKILEPDGDKQPVDQATKPTEFIGLVNLASLDANGLPLPADLGLPTTPSTTTLTAELGYNFLPSGWGKGYATESVNAVLEACRCKKSFWSPYSKLFVRAIVNEDNPASGRVMDKVGMEKKGVYHWTGKAVFLAGRWQEKSTVFIYGMYLLE